VADVKLIAVVAPEQIAAGSVVETVATGFTVTVIVFAVPWQPPNVGVTIYCTVPAAGSPFVNV